MPTDNQRRRNLRSSSSNPSDKSSAKKSGLSKQRTTKTPNETTATTTIRSDSTETPLTTKKRKAVNKSSPSSPEIIHTAKKPTHSMSNEPLTTDSMKILLSEFSKEMKAELSQTIASTVQREVNKLGEQLKLDFCNQLADINNKFDEQKQNFDKRLNEMKAKVDSCSDRASIGEDDVQRITKLCELKIKGIPYTQGEKLLDLFTSIAQHVGFDLSQPNHMPVLSRIQSKKKDTNEMIQLPIIIVKFIAKHIRDGFYSLYLSKISSTPLKTEHINLTPGNRVIICENLTATNHKIFSAAMQMKIDNKLAKVFTKDGLVLVKKTSDSKAHIIRSTRDLDLCLIEAATTSSNSASNNNNGNTIKTVTDASNGSVITEPMQT